MERRDLDIILTQLIANTPDVSDINVSVGYPFQVEHRGSLMPHTNDLALQYLSPYQTQAIARCIIGSNKRAINDLLKTGSCDIAYATQTNERFRVNIFSVRGNYALVLRRLNSKIPTLDDLKAPPVLHEVIKEKNGLILVTGATGSGKSTTLAAMLRLLNENQAIHIVTLEDPIEFVHGKMKATFNQRELGTDFDTFANGLRAALRQAPKVILVGELRDRATLEVALTAAETGHLVVSSLHTVDAGQTVQRILGMFDKEEEDQVRIRLSGVLRWIVCQRLLPTISGSRVAAHEIMGSNLRIRELIEQGEDDVKTFFNVIEAAEPQGWQTFESCLTKLFQAGTITEEIAMQSTTRRNLLRLRLDYVKSKKGEKTSDLEGLKIDAKYEQKFFKP